MQVEINFRICRTIVSEIQEAERRLRRRRMELDEVIRELRTIQDEAILVFAYNLQKQNSKLIEEQRKLQVMRLALEKIIYLYRKTESNISDQVFWLNPFAFGFRPFPGTLVLMNSSPNYITGDVLQIASLFRI